MHLVSSLYESVDAMDDRHTMGTTATKPVKLNNYDVILHRSSDDAPLHIARSVNHVGNLRFQIMIESIFRQRYLQSELFADDYECESIVQEVVDTICCKCVPNGRFFLLQDDNSLQQLESYSSYTTSMIHNALQKYPVKDSSANAVQSRSTKRIRRPDTCVSTSGFDLLAHAASKQLLVERPDRFDVICTTRGISQSQHTGNNRLKVMFTIRMKKYNSSNQEVKQQIVEEVVSSIIDDAGGRFLQQDKKSGNKYKILSRVSAVTCVRKALDSVAGGEKKEHRDAEVKKLVQRKQRKDILDKLERKSGGMNKRGSLIFSSSGTPPTTFNTLVRQKSMVPKAA